MAATALHSVKPRLTVSVQLQFWMVHEASHCSIIIIIITIIINIIMFEKCHRRCCQGLWVANSRVIEPRTCKDSGYRWWPLEMEVWRWSWSRDWRSWDLSEDRWSSDWSATAAARMPLEMSTATSACNVEEINSFSWIIVWEAWGVYG